ncbi:N-terminal C2 in EEIG1 and EHBP1 proteins-domain-containing protein [Lophiotrema nucula]|uniref:N-terminal C2 in EEIG1 and EHBP1 proteins-domain-containing protein n=1 Tax=Lophiotrema nucula TaxID=690887 RepID=A0A6A5Z4M9_9PLEO|nr:N-terminal C2 in EEIG1 and EHBP1 proteins-domain-containing protein [Lophiotrema nucula]
MSIRRTVAFAAHTLTVPPVPKNRRPKFELHLKILDLNNVPLVTGTTFIKWHLPHSTSAEHRGRTEKCPIKDHKVFYDYSIKTVLRLTVDKNNQLQDSFVEFEVVQEYSAGGRGERITLGYVRINLAEYVESSELQVQDGDDWGVTRRYLMQESKINSTLKISIYMRHIEGDKNFIAPPLKTAQVFSGIAGIVAGEQADGEESGAVPSLNTNSRETGELQDMYRRTLAAYWAAQPGELKADEAIEDIFSGGDGWGDRDKPYDSTTNSAHNPRQIRFSTNNSSGSSEENEERHRRAMSIQRKSHETLRPGDVLRSPSRAKEGRGRASLEQQAHHMKAEAEMKRNRPLHEVDEFAVRDDLCSWRLPI